MFALFSYLLVHCYYFVLWASNKNSFPKPLNAQQERECFARMAKGEWEAQNTLIEHNLRLVAHVIKKYYASHKEQEDLISIGTMGLIKAVKTFNPEKGTRLATYAARCIENEVLMHFRSSKRLSSELFLSDTIDSDKEGNTLALMDILSNEESIDEQVEKKIQVQKLYGYIDALLNPREKHIITMRYGLFGSKPHTQREIAAMLDISRSYASRIEKRALLKLRSEFED